MALVDPELGKEYGHSDEMPHFAELQRFQTRLGAEALGRVGAAIGAALDAVPVGRTVTAAQLIAGRTDVWSAPYDAIYVTCAGIPGVTDPYKTAALRLGQLVKAAVIDRDQEWWRIFRSSRVTTEGDDVSFAVYERVGPHRR